MEVFKKMTSKAGDDETARARPVTFAFDLKKNGAEGGT
jgi:hypothetical protein